MNKSKKAFCIGLVTVLISTCMGQLISCKPKTSTNQSTNIDTSKKTQAPPSDISSFNSTIKMDEAKKAIVEAFLTAANNRDFNKLTGFYAPTIRRNWDLYNPTIAQIQTLTQHLWDVTSSSIQSIQQIEMENDSTIKAAVTNVYITRKKNLHKELDYYIYYVFDSNNRIVETYGYKKDTLTDADNTSKKAYSENGNVFFRKEDGSVQQISFKGQDSLPQVSSDNKFIVYVRTENTNISQEEYDTTDKRDPSFIMLYDLTTSTEKTIVKGSTNFEEKANIDYGGTDAYPFTSLCSIDNIILSHDNTRVYFKTEAWTVCPAVHYYDFTLNKIVFFHSGDLLGIDKNDNVKVVLTDIDWVNGESQGRYWQTWLLDKKGKKIKALSEKEQ